MKTQGTGSDRKTSAKAMFQGKHSYHKPVKMQKIPIRSMTGNLRPV